MYLKTLSTLAGVALLASTNLQAAPIVLEGNYVKTAISEIGTLGSGHTTPPGILHDATGTRNFGINDYLTPGSPHEIFAIKSDQTGLLVNNNDYSMPSPALTGTLTNTSGTSGYDHSVNWTSTSNALFTISTDTFFNDGDERISFSTVITALADLSSLQFLRSLDPDPDVNTYDSYDTQNGRGNAAQGLAEKDWVHSIGVKTGLTIGLYTDSSVSHNTGISSYWEVDPAFYLTGNNDGHGDYTIGLAFDIGTLLAGQSITLEYHYVMGGSLDTVDLPKPDHPPVSVPEPATLGLLGLGLAALGLRRSRRSA